MTNMQCYSYGIMALDELVKSGEKITSNNFYCNLYYLWDRYSEEAIEKVVQEKEINGNLI